jgi:transposase
MTGKEEKRPSYDDLLEENRRLRRENESLREEVERLKRLVEELRRQAKRQAAPFSKSDPVADPKKPGRKPGRRYGRRAHRSPPPHIDEVLEAPLPCECPCCGGEIEYLKVKRQFQAEIPRKVIWRQFNIEIGRCRHCQRRVQGRHPLQTSDALGAAASQLGPDAQALVVQLKNEVGLPYGKITRLFQVAFGVSLSRGGAAQVVLRAAERSKGIYQKLLVVVRRSSLVYPDETGWRVAGLLNWLWTFVTEHATVYLIRPSRGGEVAEEVLGTEYGGIIGHDGWSPYDGFLNALHQQCLAHLLRRSKELLEVATRGAVRFPRQIKGLLQDALALRDRRDAGAISTHGLAVATGRLESRLDRLLAWTRSDEANERFAKHLDNHRNQIFTFLRHPEVQATNWPAEQALRPPITTRKVWGGNRTWAGAHAQEVLSSVLRTCWQQGRNGIDFLSRMLRANSPRRQPRLFLPGIAPG